MIKDIFNLHHRVTPSVKRPRPLLKVAQPVVGHCIVTPQFVEIAAHDTIFLSAVPFGEATPTRYTAAPDGISEAVQVTFNGTLYIPTEEEIAEIQVGPGPIELPPAAAIYDLKALWDFGEIAYQGATALYDLGILTGDYSGNSAGNSGPVRMHNLVMCGSAGQRPGPNTPLGTQSVFLPAIPGLSIVERRRGRS